MQKRSAEGNRSNTHQLKTYFAKRVTDQVRHVLGIWRMLTDENWPDNHILDLLESNKKLIRYAQHFQEESHLQLGQQIAHTLKKIKEDDGTLNSAVVTQLTELIKKLSQLASRKNDVTNNTETAIEPKKPVYLALNDHVLGQKIEQQLEFFGYKAELIHDSSHFKLRARPNDAIAIIMDVNFDNRFHNGIELIEQLIKEAKVPTIFYSEDGADIHTLLRASRAQGRFFHNATIDMSRIVEEVELITHQTPEAPFRVLIVEDSRTQAFHIEQILNNAGIISKAILDPMLILDALEEFKPEIILMDMYMPVCNGMELANVIRQQDQFVSIPIVFLSAEDDIEKQLNAMSNGGDDFLTKPIKSHHLITAVRNKGKRARKLVALVNQDSLTGLLNHTSILR